MRYVIVIFFALGLISLEAFAKLEVIDVDQNTFSNLPISDLDTGGVYYTFTAAPIAFADWKASSPVEFEYLTPFDGYVEPSFPKRRGGDPITEKIHVFSAKAKAVLNRTINAEDLAGLMSVEFIASIDPEIKHKVIDHWEVMPVVAGTGKKLKNFRWNSCDPEGTWIKRHEKEINLSVLHPQGRDPWCTDRNRSLCLESCFLFTNRLWKVGVQTVNMLETDSPKDFGISSQSEVRYFLNESEMGKRSRLSGLTGINTEVLGALEQNIFYFNQVMQYGKVLAVFQSHPADNSKVIATSFIVIGLRSRSYNKHAALRDVLMGVSPVNTESGLTAGLPVFTRNMTRAIVESMGSK